MKHRGWGQRFLDLPLRLKFLLSFLAVIVFGGILTLYIGTRLEHKTIFDLALAKVRHDLSSAWTVYTERLNDIRDFVRLNSGRESVRTALRAGDLGSLEGSLGRIRTEFGLDILTLTDAQGLVVHRVRRPGLSGDDQSHDPFVRRALQRARPLLPSGDKSHGAGAAGDVERAIPLSPWQNQDPLPSECKGSR